MANRYTLSYVINARKFCVYDNVTGRRTHGSEGRKDAEGFVTALNTAEQAFRDSEAERKAL